jgi:hypothetical protein
MSEDVPTHVARQGRLLAEHRAVTATAIGELTFLRKLQRLLAEGDFVATYKFALLNALADLSLEREPAADGSLRVPAIRARDAARRARRAAALAHARDASGRHDRSDAALEAADRFCSAASAQASTATAACCAIIRATVASTA